MRHRLAMIGLVIFVASGTSLVIHRPSFSRPQAKLCGATPCGARASEPTLHEFDFAYYSLRDGFKSTLFLVSHSPKPIDFVVRVHNLSGRLLVAPAMTISPQAKLTVELSKLLGEIASDVQDDFAEGSVSIRYRAMGPMPLLGQITIENVERGLVYESQMVENDPGHSEIPPVLETLWWGLSAGREATVAISNTGDQRASADLFLEFQGTRHPSASLDFRPHETKVLSVSELLSELEVSPAQAPEGGITIIARGENPILMAQGKILDATTGFSTTLHFPLPQRQRASALHASGVPIGTPSNNSPFAGMGTFTPHVIVRNLSPATQNVRITVEYPTEKGSDLAVLPPFALDANTTQGISLDSVMGELPLPLPYCSIRIQYSGPPGSAMAEVSSIEEKGNLVIDSRFANEGDGWAGSGANPWHIDAETESFLFLSNMGEKESRIGLQIKADGVLYNVTDLKLGPHETRAIRLRELRDAQRPDFQGNKIPAGATDGSVSWIRLDLVPVMGRLVVMQPGKGIVSNYDCCPCSCPPSFYGVATNPLTVDLLPNTTVNCTCQAQYLDCNQVVVSSDATSSATWSSGNTAVATVDNSVFKGRVTGIDGGSSNIAATITDYQCFSDPLGNCTLTAVVISGGITVRTRVARWAVLGSDSGMVNTANCPFTPGALERNRVYAGYDDFGRVPFNQNWTLNERLVSPTNCGAILGGNDFIVDFTDTISVCQTACTLQTEQTFTINARLVGARDCADFTNPACAAHTGWRVAASYNFSTLTPY